VKILRPTECAAALGVSKTTLWRMTKRPGFPVAFRLGPNSVGWDESEIVAWLEARRVRPDSVRPVASEMLQ
jgi:prophage regulatory protein